ncbi:SNF2-related protein [Ruegeria arenilitoris]|uniref:SNF2-related protein n=1 Tax=Ruegeria arenilitoris TaxID=1173585 RepID=UPI00148000BF|nr:SNF2-related protein [Ruegeria arenilitoris]
MDHYLRFVNCVQALRRRVSALDIGLGGALGVAADPLPYQIATVRRVLGDAHIRHLISDEVGLGKTVQALMIVNALRWQDTAHRSLVIAPDNLLAQWQEECWIRGHVMPALAGSIGDGTHDEMSPITLVRPRDLMIRPGQGTRTISADPAVFDLLIVDEPQTMPRDAIQAISQAADEFRQVLVLSATPRLGDPAWREPILRMIEPEAAALARMEGRSVADMLQDREEAAIASLNGSDGPDDWTRAFLQSGASRRIIRNGRSEWNEYLPQRRNHEVRLQPLESERMRHEIAAMVLEGADPADGIQGPAWTAARALQRSARAARTVLTELATRGGALAQMAEAARIKSLEDPGDSRLEALLDILSEQWCHDEDRAFIIVCGDNPTIDMLRAALPRYFPFLADGISVLRRPAATEVEGVTNLREIQETLAPLLSRENRLLLVGDWVQAGLNLHHVAQGIIFFSLPWEIDGIDQLIGRVDRLGPAGDRKRSRRIIDIWRILIEGSQEAAIADTVAALGVFDSPLPPLSPSEVAEIQTVLGRAAIGRRATLSIAPLTGNSTGLPSFLKEANPFTHQQATDEFDQWRQKPCPGPAMLSELARPTDTPIRREERAIGAWLKTITASRDFDIGYRRDKIDDYGFQTIWYHGVGERGRAGDSPFALPGASRESWMSGHVPFIYRRADISAPPRKVVFTDDGERSGAGERSGRPLRFLDHGSELHDGLVAGYTAACFNRFGTEKPVVQTSVRLPEGHPARGIGPLVIISAALIDPFPDGLLPPVWTPRAKEILASAPTDTQRRALSADRFALQALFHALQRKVRFAAPAKLIRVGSLKARDCWQDLAEDDVDRCLEPITSSTNNALAKGRTPPFLLEKQEVLNSIRSRHLAAIEERVEQNKASVLNTVRQELAGFALQVSAHFQAEIKNRELALERRRQSPPDAGPLELWQGQVAALERSLSVARLNYSEATTFVREFAGGSVLFGGIQPFTVLMALVADD